MSAKADTHGNKITETPLYAESFDMKSTNYSIIIPMDRTIGFNYQGSMSLYVFFYLLMTTCSNPILPHMTLADLK